MKEVRNLTYLNTRKIIALAILLLFCLDILNSGPVLKRAGAQSLQSTYELLRDNPQYAGYLDELRGAGVNDVQINAFLDALDAEVAARGSLTESTFNSVLFNSMDSLRRTGNYNDMFFAILGMLESDEILTILRGGIPASLIPLRNAVRDSMLGPPGASPAAPGSAPGGGFGGGLIIPLPDPLAAEIQRQLETGGPVVRLVPAGSTGEFVLSGALLNKINAAGKELELVFPGVTFRLPPGAMQLAGAGTLAISAHPLDAALAARLLQDIGPEHQLVGSIYELLGSTDSSILGVNFFRPVTVVLSYAGAGGELLDVYYYDEDLNEWIKMNGEIDEGNQTISFTTLHLSKYAVFSSSSKEPARQAVKVSFTDMAGHWAASDIETMVRLGLVAGVSPTQFAPDRTITRAEFAALLARATGLETAGQVTNCFTDVLPGKWYYGVVNAAAEVGLVSGYSAAAFGPDDPVTREQMTVMIARSLAYKGRNAGLAAEEVNLHLAAFKDGEKISPWARGSLALAVKLGIVKGREGALVAPGATATRAEAAVMILRMLAHL